MKHLFIKNYGKGALQHVADVFNGSFATFELIDKRNGCHLQHHDSSELEIQDKYLGYYMPKNPRIAFGNRTTSPSLIHDALFISEQEMDRNEFYSDFLRPHDLRYCLAFKAYETVDEIGCFTIQKSSRSGPANEDELAAIKTIAPMLSSVANIQSKHHELLGQIQDFESIFDTISDGVVLIDGKGTIVNMNHAAIDILDMIDGLSVSEGRLKSVDSKNDALLSKLISDISGGNLIKVVRYLLIPRPSGLPPYEVSFQSLARTEITLDERESRTILFIRDPVRSSSIEIDSLVDCFGFTKAEANVSIAIARGQSANEIAVTTSTSLATIRTQIQRVMQKMHVNRQSEIVRILSNYV